MLAGAVTQLHEVWLLCTRGLLAVVAPYFNWFYAIGRISTSRWALRLENGEGFCLMIFSGTGLRLARLSVGSSSRPFPHLELPVLARLLPVATQLLVSET
jgi:hypothetical protein